MIALVIIIFGNSVIYLVLQWFVGSPWVQKMGGASVTNVIGLGLVCISSEIFFLMNGIKFGRVDTSDAVASTMLFSFVSAIPWIFTFYRILGEMTEDVAEDLAAGQVDAKDTVNLKPVYALIQEGRIDEAEALLLNLKEKSPNASEVVFVLASIAHGKPDPDLAEHYFRAIIDHNTVQY